MPSNVEIKARLRDRGGVQARAVALATEPVRVIGQEDVFFRTPKGRLKLRVFDESSGELIYYERPDQAGPKLSDYRIAPTLQPRKLQETLRMALGLRGIVKKERTLVLVGQTRVHLDRVDDLGDFMELEVVLKPGQSSADGQRIAEDLMSKLGIQGSDLIEGAYLDLLEAR
ncbi:MAG: class IV adenylate cyclase [Planctomycetes bacterium]|nr:class IV adenylate cyclase [Planctomycetota bacterium]